MALSSATAGAGSTGKTTNLIDSATAFTVMCWVFPTDATPSTNHYPFAQGLSAGTDYHLAVLVNDGTGVMHLDIENRINSAGGTNTTGTTVIPHNAWSHIALVRTSATQLLGYLNGVLEATLNTLTNAGRLTDYQNYLHNMAGRVDAYKAWGASLTAAEIAQEYSTRVPIRFTNLNAWLPTFPGSGENVRDYGGIGPDFTLTPTLTDDQPSPVAYGAPVLWVNPLWVPPSPTVAGLDRRAPYYVPARIY